MEAEAHHLWALQESGEQHRVGIIKELIETRSECEAVRSSNSSLQREVEAYKKKLQNVTSHTSALESDCSVAQESKIVTSKVPNMPTPDLVDMQSSCYCKGITSSAPRCSLPLTEIHGAQVLQSLTQQLMHERAENGELRDMLQQEGQELKDAIAANQELQRQLDVQRQQACTALKTPVPPCMHCPRLPSPASARHAASLQNQPVLCPA